MAEMKILSIAVDLPSLKLWQGKEDGDGKPLSPRTLRGDGKSDTSLNILTRSMLRLCPQLNANTIFLFGVPALP